MPPSPGDPLTPREAEVARLAAQGLQAKQIARRLHIGKRTVNCHLEKIHAKAGVGNRVGLLNWLLERQQGAAP